MKNKPISDGVCIDWISPHPNHYHSFLLKKLVGVPNLSIRAVYVSAKLSLYPWKTDYMDGENVYVFRTLFGIDWKLIVSSLRSTHRLQIIAGWNVPTCFLLITLLAMLDRAFILYSDTPDVGKKRVGLAQALRGIWVRWVYRKMWKHFITGNVGIEALMQYGVARNKLVNFPFATDLDLFTPARTALNNSVTTFFSSGRLDIAHKGYDVILRALANLRATKTDVCFKYIIAGSGPDEAEIRELINSYGLQENVEILGWLEPNELLALYQAADFFIHPSNFDPFPNAVLEAMACGLPIIGSDLAGTVIDRVSHGVSGFVFRAGDHVDLQNQIIRAFNLSGTERRQMGLASRRTALRWDVSHNIEVVERIVQIYQRWKTIFVRKDIYA